MKRLRIEGLSKNFDGSPVLQDIDLELEPGEIHGLIGINGSGKSTLLNILCGAPVIRHSGGFSGKILLDGRPLVLKSPHQAVKTGIAMVHQEPTLFDRMSVYENILLTQETVFGWVRNILGRNLALINRRQNRLRTMAILKNMAITLNPTVPTGTLPLHVQQFIEIARETMRKKLKLLLLDEPATALTDESMTRLHKLLLDLAGQGTTILYVSHRLKDILAVCDRITILRHGRIVGRVERSEADLGAISEQMVGHVVGQTYKTRNNEDRETFLECRDFRVQMPNEPLLGVNLKIHRGEILGLAGLDGHGKAALAPGLMGLHPAAGQVWMLGKKVAQRSPIPMIRAGIYFIPENQKNRGLLQDYSVFENIVFGAVQIKGRFVHNFPIRSLGLVLRRQSAAYARTWIKHLEILCRSSHQKIRELSGGNQQKVVLARALALEPKLLMLHEPTRGIDLGAKETILNLLVRINAEQGVTLLIASSDLDELRRICDRIAVFHQGRISAMLSADSPEKEFAAAFIGTVGVQYLEPVQTKTGSF